MADPLAIEVVYALPGQQELGSVQLPAGSCVREAIEVSGMLQRFPAIDPAKTKVGIYSKLTKLDAVLRDKDRVEIYRPLIADPKEVRKQRAAEGKVMKKGGGALEE